jgi:hypothetical protein
MSWLNYHLCIDIGLTFRDRKRIYRQEGQYIYRGFRDRLQNFGIGVGFNERQRAREHQMLYRGASEKNPRIKPSEKTYIFSSSITVHYSSYHRSSSCRFKLGCNTKVGFKSSEDFM